MEQRTRIGDFEGDTLVGKNHQGAIVSLVERKTLFTLMAVIPNRTATTTADACIRLLKPVHAHTITFDNGKEFAAHKHIAQNTRTDIFFADPYHSNQRARNENTNGLIRQFFPKKSNFTLITAQQINHAQNSLNNRPRKSLHWMTPIQAFAHNTNIQIQSQLINQLNKTLVALQS